MIELEAKQAAVEILKRDLTKADVLVAEMKGELDKLTQELYDSKYIAASRLELLRRVARLVDPITHEPGECEDCNLMREVMKELGDD